MKEPTLKDFLDLLKATKREHIAAINPFDRMKILKELDRISHDISIENHLEISKKNNQWQE